MFLRKNRAGPHFHFHKRGRGSGPAPYQLQDRKKRFYFIQQLRSWIIISVKLFFSHYLVWSTLPERAEMNTGVLHRRAASGSALRAAGNIRHWSAGASRPTETKILQSHPPQKSVSSKSSPSNVSGRQLQSQLFSDVHFGSGFVPWCGHHQVVIVWEFDIF